MRYTIKELKDGDAYRECANCRFWEKTASKSGACLFNPPLIIATMCKAAPSDSVDDDTIKLATRWPITHKTEWCGKWEIQP